MDTLYLSGFVAVMAVATFCTRAAPFWLLGGRADHPLLAWLGRMLPPAVMTLLVLYCLKGTAFAAPPHGANELLAVALVVALHLWRRNALASIGAGTALYMILLQTGALAALPG